MDDYQPRDDVAETRHLRLGLKVALVSAGLAAGVIGATALGASAETSTPSTPSTSTSSTPAGTTAGATQAPSHDGRRPAGGHGGADPVRSDEKSVGSADAATLKAAALAKVPGGTVYRVETDAGDGEYEVHMSKADGSLVTVKFDKDLKVTKVETGMGSGDPAPAGRAPAGH